MHKFYICHKDRHTDQWNRIESPELNPYIYGQMILTRVSRQLNEESIVFSTNGAGAAGYPYTKESYLKPYTKINSEWIKDLNAKVETIKILDKNISINVHDLGLGNSFLDMTPKA